MKIYVGNLPFSATEKDLQETFSKFGEVSEVALISDKFSGRSKGFGFVTFANDEDAKKAIEELDGKDFQGRSLKLSEAKPMDPDRPRRPPRRDFNNRQRRF
jgi:RNA recognition motif-containing protein